MYVRLEDPTLVAELISFLARCNRRAEQVGRHVVKIEVEHRDESQAALRLVHAGRCLDCGGEIESPLAELGSLRCLDCRDRNGHGNGTSRQTFEPRSPAAPDVQLDGYLRVFAALHPDAELTPLDAFGRQPRATTAS